MGKHRNNHRQKARESAPFAEKEQGEQYVFITGILGSGRFEGSNDQGASISLKVRGCLYKRAWISKGSVCLASARVDLGKTMDIIWVYSADEVKMLKRYGEVTSTFDIGGGNGQFKDPTDEDIVVFEDTEFSAI